MTERESSSDTEKQPHDYVTARERVDLGQHVSNVTRALERPSSVLLFTVVLVIVLVGASWLETSRRGEVLGKWLDQIETNRAAESQECHTTLRQVLSSVSARQNYEAYIDGKSK